MRASSKNHPPHESRLSPSFIFLLLPPFSLILSWLSPFTHQFMQSFTTSCTVSITESLPCSRCYTWRLGFTEWVRSSPAEGSWVRYYWQVLQKYTLHYSTPVDNTFHFILNYKQRCCIHYINDRFYRIFTLVIKPNIYNNPTYKVTNRKQVIKSYILKPSVSSPAYSKWSCKLFSMI